MPQILANMGNPPDFDANPQPWMLILLVVGIAGAVAAVTFLVLKSLPKRKPAGYPPLQNLADHAQIALDDIEEAKIDFDDVIIRCYAEMNQTLQAENDIRRAQTMTTYEFAQELLEKGFPTRPVEQLTQLFEQVRYGNQQPGEHKKQVAIESLQEIVKFCREQA